MAKKARADEIAEILFGLPRRTNDGIPSEARLRIDALQGRAIFDARKIATELAKDLALSATSKTRSTLSEVPICCSLTRYPAIATTVPIFCSTWSGSSTICARVPRRFAYNHRSIVTKRTFPWTRITTAKSTASNALHGDTVTNPNSADLQRS